MHPINRRALLGASLAATALAGTSARAKSAAPIAETRYGKVKGYWRNGIACFKGVRYGADTAPRRFLPALTPKPWAGVAETLDYGPAAPQSHNGEKQSEDCLVLNVWTPGLRDGKKRPVMFYIHGGAYSEGSGSSPLYDGVNLARRGDAVVVTVNHRLNIFGYLSLARFDAHYPDSGNIGQIDLVMALQWVRDNIAAFGGDPNCVFAFGQSGGGAKIATMMAMPAARGLFHRATTMSGNQVTACGPLHAMKRTEAFLKQLGLTPKDIGMLRTMPVARLLPGMAAPDPIAEYKAGVYFGPVLDDRNLHRHPFYPDAPAQSLDIPMMIGNTHDETRLLIGAKSEKYFHLQWEDLPALLEANLRLDISPERVVKEYRRFYPHYSPSDVFFAATTAGRSWRGAIIEDEMRAQSRSPAYAYQVDWGSPLDGGKWRAPHSIDIALAFANTAADHQLTGDGPGARAMAAIVSDTFLAFARTGIPNNKAVPHWTPYSMARRETMIFDLPPRMENDPRGVERKLFARVPFTQFGT
jgi:para-nitrobenzyl esterase